jgi:hypothetical protein
MTERVKLASRDIGLTVGNSKVIGAWSKAREGTGGMGAGETGASSAQQQVTVVNSGAPAQQLELAEPAVNGCHTMKNANTMTATVFNYFLLSLAFFSASSSFFKYFFGSLLKSFLQDSQQSRISRFSCLNTYGLPMLFKSSSATRHFVSGYVSLASSFLSAASTEAEAARQARDNKLEIKNRFMAWKFLSATEL